MTVVPRLWMLGGMALLLAACGTSPPVRYFGLTAMEAAPDASVANTAVVGLGPVRLAGYLARPQIVTRQRSGEVFIDDFHRWAEPLDHNIARVLTSNVESLVPGLTVLAFPHTQLIEPDYRVHVVVDRFDADDDGTAVLIAQWGITQRDGETVAGPQRSRYEARVSATGDTRAVVTALNETLARLSEELAGQLQESATASE